MASRDRPAAFVPRIVGSHPAVMGLPLPETVNLLAGAGWRDMSEVEVFLDDTPGEVRGVVVAGRPVRTPDHPQRRRSAADIGSGARVGRAGHRA